MVTLLFAFSPTVTVTRFAPLVTDFVNNTTNVGLSIDGEVTIQPGLDTLVLVEGVKLWDKKVAAKSFLSIDKVALSLDVISLLNTPVNVQKIVLSNVTFDLVQGMNGKGNIPKINILTLMEWVDGNIATIPPFIIHDVELRHVLVNFSNIAHDLSGQWLLEEVDARWGWDSPLAVYAEGVFLGNPSKGFGDKPVTISMTADSMRRLGDTSQLWHSITRIAAEKGDVAVNLSFSPITDMTLLSEEEYPRAYKLDVVVNEFHYGELLMRLAPASKTEVNDSFTGYFGADISLEGNVSDLNKPLLKSSGVIEVSVWPENHLADALDFWTTNIINVALAGINSDSKINCAVARFNLSEGLLSSDVMVFDTSKLRVYGDGVLDFTAKTIDFLIVPKAKQIQWLDKSVPIRLKGPFESPEIEVKKMGLFKSVTKSVINFYIPVLPILINDTMESDGSKECLESMQKDGGRLKD